MTLNSSNKAVDKMEDINTIICNESQCLIINHLYTVEEYLTLNFLVKSGEFSGKSNFCVSKERIELIVQSLREVHKNLLGRIDIEDYDSDAHLVFELNRLGQAIVSGQIGGSHEEHIMRFKFISDQTILERLINLLSTIIR
jgi:hypothetical protein